MADGEKAVNSSRADRHLMRRKDLARDSVKQEKFINRLRERMGLPPIKRKKVEEDKTSVEFLEGDRLGVENGDLILEQRLYTRTAGGRLVGERKDEDACVAAHSKIRRERAHYRDLDGRMVVTGDVVSERKGKYMESRKDKERRASGVLRSVMLRLMPHEGEIAGEFLGEGCLARAMDKTVEQFAGAVDCDVVSAVAHRMNPWDCHIHIQYTMIKPFEQTASMLGRRLAPWKKKAAAMARAVLQTEGNSSPASRTVGAKIEALIESGELEPRPVAEIEYRKTKGKRSLREDVIMGYSFRHKLNLVRLAEEAGDLELAERVIRRRDNMGRFRPVAKRADSELEERYLDLWLERVWRKSVREELPEIAVEKLLPAGVASAADYATYGTVLVEDTHLDIRKAELDEQQAALEAAAANALQESEAAAKEAELAFRRMEETARNRAEAAELEARKAVKEKEAAEVAVIEKDLELQRVRMVAANNSKDAKSQIVNLEEQNKKSADLVVRFIGLLQMILNLPGFMKLLAAAANEVTDAIKALCAEVGLEFGGAESKSPQHDNEVRLGEQRDPLAGHDDNLSQPE